LKQKIDEAVAKLESLLVSRVCDCGSLTITDIRQAEEGKKGPKSNVEQITAGKEAIAKAKTAKREIA
jgi:tubulin-specific chaperone A